MATNPDLFGNFLAPGSTPLGAPKVRAPNAPAQSPLGTSDPLAGSPAGPVSRLQKPAFAPRQAFSAPPLTPTASPTSRTSSNVAKPAGIAQGAFSMAPPPPTVTNPGNNLNTPGFTEQGLVNTQNRLLNDPFAGAMNNQYNQTQAPQRGETYLNQNLGTLDGPGEGDQYWNQVQGQFNDPFAGEQFTREATQNMAPTGPAGAFFGQAQQQYGQFTGYTGPQNTQGQYGQSSQQLANGSQGERGLGSIAGQYDSMGRYSDPNLAAGQYAQTQQAFGDLPIANFDPFYDRASQLGVQNYNRQAAGRGVYGSSEALSGVGNVITDIEAQRANRSFDAEMQRAQEQRARQALLGEQARAGDLSSVAAFGANLAGAETFGQLNNQLGNQELNRTQVLGNLANQADNQALGAQEANLSGLSAFGNLAGQADSAETNRFNARTGAMTDADRTGLQRLQTGADIAFRGDDSARADFTASSNAANQAASLGLDRTRLGADIASQGSRNDLARLDAFMGASGMAEDDRQARQNAALDAMSKYTGDIQRVLSEAATAGVISEYQSFEDWFNAEIAPAQQGAAYDQQQKDTLRKDAMAVWKVVKDLNSSEGPSD